MADVNYINPMALKPEIGWAPKNALAGMMYHQNNQDYRTMFDQQQRMQAMAEEQKRMQMEAARKDVPLQDLERQNKMSLGQGQAPFMAQLGSSGARSQINTNEAAASPEALRAKVAQFAQQADDATWKRVEKPLEFMSQALGPAIEMMRQGNQMGAQQFMQQQVQRAQQMGLDIPPDIMDPKSWPGYYQFALEAPKHRQEMQVEGERTKRSQNVAEISGGYGLQQGRERNASNERIAEIGAGSRVQAAGMRQSGSTAKFSTDQNLNRLVGALAEIPDGEPVDGSLVRQLESVASQQFERTFGPNMILFTNNDPKQKAAMEEARARYIENIIQPHIPTYKYNPQSRGSGAPAPTQQQQQQPAQAGGAKADPLGLR
jgi:hypothetical protein